MSSETTVKVGSLKDQSYESWCIEMKAVLDSLDLWKIVNGDIPCPVAETSGDGNSIENVEQWFISDEKAKKLIMSTINEPELGKIKDSNTSHEMWMKLKEIFESKGPDMKMLFMKKLLSFKMNDGQDVRSHVEDFSDTVEQLTKMEVAMNEEYLCKVLLQSLPNSFQSFRSEMESMDKLLPLEDLARKIVEEGIRKKDFETPKDPRAIESVLALKDSVTTNTLEQKPFWPVGDFTFNVSKKIDGRTCWVLDTKLPYHCCSEALFSRITPAEFAESVLMAGPDWTLDPGTLNICSQYPERSLTIHDILCIRGFQLNILSVGRIEDMGYQVIFEPTHACIVDKNGRNILIAYKIGDLYSIIEDIYKETTFAYDDAKPTGRSSGIFNRLTKWLGMSSRH